MKGAVQPMIVVTLSFQKYVVLTNALVIQKLPRTALTRSWLQSVCISTSAAMRGVCPRLELLVLSWKRRKKYPSTETQSEGHVTQFLSLSVVVQQLHGECWLCHDSNTKVGSYQAAIQDLRRRVKRTGLWKCNENQEISKWCNDR